MCVRVCVCARACVCTYMYMHVSGCALSLWNHARARIVIIKLEIFVLFNVVLFKYPTKSCYSTVSFLFLFYRGWNTPKRLLST